MKDLFHTNVREALIKDGWNITDDPYRIDIGVTFLDVDLAAEAVFVAERAGEKIAVEIKSFVGKSIISEFHTAIGQYADYRDALEESEPDRSLFLAVPVDVYESTVFQSDFIQKRPRKESAKLIIYSPEDNTIVSWKK